MYPINFTANYVDTVNILHRNKNNEKKNKEVAVVELDKQLSADRGVMLDVASLWQKGDKHNYAWDVLDVMERDTHPNVEKEHFIVLTTQKSNYKKIDPKKVLGVMAFDERYFDEYSIEWLQVKPGYAYSSVKDNRKYFHIGQALIDYVKNNYKSKPIYVSSAVDAVNFYIKNKFVPYDVFGYSLRYFV